MGWRQLGTGRVGGVPPCAIIGWHRNPRGSWSLSELEGQCGEEGFSWRTRKSQGVGHKLVLHCGHFLLPPAEDFLRKAFPSLPALLCNLQSSSQKKKRLKLINSKAHGIPAPPPTLRILIAGFPCPILQNIIYKC